MDERWRGVVGLGRRTSRFTHIYLTEFIPALEMPVNPDVWLPQHRRFSFHVIA
jgi:hypothetical protein